ncbi:FERM domain-containing protein 4B isoform X1 [Tachysurus ichikawai]
MAWTLAKDVETLFLRSGRFFLDILLWLLGKCYIRTMMSYLRQVYQSLDPYLHKLFSPGHAHIKSQEVTELSLYV